MRTISISLTSNDQTIQLNPPMQVTEIGFASLAWTTPGALVTSMPNHILIDIDEYTTGGIAILPGANGVTQTIPYTFSTILPVSNDTSVVYTQPVNGMSEVDFGAPRFITTMRFKTRFFNNSVDVTDKAGSNSSLVKLTPSNPAHVQLIVR